MELPQQDSCRELDNQKVRAFADKSAGELADNRLGFGRIGDDPELAGKKADPDEDERKQATHPDQYGLGIRDRRRLEGGDAV